MKLFSLILWLSILIIDSIYIKHVLSIPTSHNKRYFPCKVTSSVMSAFISDVTQSVCGQPLAVDLVRSSLTYHFDSAHFNTAPLVLSWHGEAGIGKSSFANVLSQYFPTFVMSGLDELKRNKKIDEPINIEKIVRDSIHKCPQTVFLFDDADLLPSEVLNSLLQFIDGTKKDLAKHAVFIFIMNYGAEVINEVLSTVIPGEDDENDEDNDDDIDNDDDDDDNNDNNTQDGSNIKPVIGKRNLLIRRLTTHRFARDDGDSSKYESIIKVFKNEIYYAMMSSGRDKGNSKDGNTDNNPSLNSGQNTATQNRGFFNHLVTRNLIQHVVPFFPLTKREVSCCFERSLIDVRHKLTSPDQAYLHIPFTDIHLKWFGHQKKTLGIKEFHWSRYTPFSLAKEVEYDNDGISIDGCRSVEPTLTTMIIGPITNYYHKKLVQAKKQREKNISNEGDGYLAYLFSKTHKEVTYDMSKVSVALKANGDVLIQDPQVDTTHNTINDDKKKDEL